MRRRFRPMTGHLHLAPNGAQGGDGAKNFSVRRGTGRATPALPRHIAIPTDGWGRRATTDTAVVQIL